MKQMLKELRYYVLLSFFLSGVCVAFGQEDASSVVNESRQNDTRYYRHEVNVSFAIMSLPDSQWEDYIDNVYDALSIEHSRGLRLFPFSPTSRSKGVLLSYYYHINPYIALGAMTAFTKNSDSLYKFDEGKYKGVAIIDGNFSGKFFFFMPSFKCSFLNCHWCSLYTKASIGLHSEWLKTEVKVSESETYEDFKKNKLRFAYMWTPFGWEVGKQNVRGFFEFGIGLNSNLQIGLTYRFGRYK